MTCKLAAADGLAYAWVDTCCIDKSSSAEPTEAINSMFQWYNHAAICYVYLSDLKSSADVSTALKNCRWFKRGWILQELIAPHEVGFFDQNWHFKGHKKYLLDEISAITGIGSTILSHTLPLSSVTVATRMSWAAHRETTRKTPDIVCSAYLMSICHCYTEKARKLSCVSKKRSSKALATSAFLPGRQGRV